MASIRERPPLRQRSPKKRSPRQQESRERGIAPIACLLFASGACALVFQVAWMRAFRLVFGASTPATAAVVAIFMAGLGLGNALLGRVANRSANPLRLYAKLEIGVSLLCAASPMVLALCRSLYVASGGEMVLGSAGAAGLRIMLAAVVMLPATICMGGTLPAACKAAVSASDVGRRRVGLLYGINTLGAVLGALLCTFWLLEAAGIRFSIWSACAINLAIAAVAWRLSKHSFSIPDEEASAPLAHASGREAHGLSPRIAYSIAAIVGFAFFVMEMVWYRLLSPILGGTTFTFGLILAVVLAGIGLGGCLYSAIYRRRPPTSASLLLVTSLEAMAIAIPFALGDWIALRALELHRAAPGFLGLIAGWTGIASLVVLPAAIVSGVQFPMLIALLGRGSRSVARECGTAFAFNTAGGIIGVLAGGFGLIPALGVLGLWRAVVVLLAVLCFVLVFATTRRKGLRPLAFPAFAILAALGSISFTGPTAAWRHSGIGAGRANLAVTPDANAIRNWMNERRRNVYWQADGVESCVGLDRANGLAFVVNGKSDGNAVHDAGTQVMFGLVGALLHPQPKSVFVVGLGTGESAGWLAQVPETERVDVVEFEPAIEEVARICAPVNFAALDNPKVRCIRNDAREVLLTTPQSYDLIVSEPSNPYRSGISALYTSEFYTAVSSRMNDGGYFLQWLQAYEVDGQTVRSVLATLSRAFKHVEVWQTKPRDLLLVCSNSDQNVDVSGVRERMEQEPFRSALRVAWRVDDLDGVFAHFVAGEKTVHDFCSRDSASINTDDRNNLDYGFSRTLGRTAGFEVGALRDLARENGDSLPAWATTVANRETIETRRMEMLAARGEKISLNPGANSEQQRRAEAFNHYLTRNMVEAAKTWSSLSKPPTGPTEIAALAHCQALDGNDTAAALAEQLEEFSIVEAEIARSILALRKGKADDSVAHLETAAAGLRTDPWHFTPLVEDLLGVGIELAERSPEFAARVYAAFKEPFGMSLLDEQRRVALFLVAQAHSDELTAEAAAQFEPYPLWNESFLKQRAAAYAATNDPLAKHANAELQQFRAVKP